MHSSSEEVSYEVSATLTNADFVNAGFLRVGEPHSILLQGNKKAVYRFIIDENAEVKVSLD